MLGEDETPLLFSASTREHLANVLTAALTAEERLTRLEARGYIDWLTLTEQYSRHTGVAPCPVSVRGACAPLRRSFFEPDDARPTNVVDTTNACAHGWGLRAPATLALSFLSRFLTRRSVARSPDCLLATIMMPRATCSW